MKGPVSKERYIEVHKEMLGDHRRCRSDCPTVHEQARGVLKNINKYYDMYVRALMWE